MKLRTSGPRVVQKRKPNYNANSYSKLNVFQERDKYTFQFLIPGYSKSEIEILFENNTLAIFTKVKDKSIMKRRVQLPKQINEESISAELSKGILSISFSKIEKEVKRINIK